MKQNGRLLENLVPYMSDKQSTQVQREAMVCVAHLPFRDRMLDQVNGIIFLFIYYIILNDCIIIDEGQRLLICEDDSLLEVASFYFYYITLIDSHAKQIANNTSIIKALTKSILANKSKTPFFPFCCYCFLSLFIVDGPLGGTLRNLLMTKSIIALELVIESGIVEHLLQVCVLAVNIFVL